MTLVKERFGGEGIYQFALISAINRLVKKSAQLLIATHSPILLSFPGAAIYQFSEQGIEQREYEYTDHYQLTKRFLENPKRMLDILLHE